MSRRFGRNQKRAYREQVATLKQKVAAQEHDIQSLSRKWNSAEDRLAETVRVIESVCEHSVALPPKEMNGSSGRHTIRLPIYQKIPYKIDDMYVGKSVLFEGYVDVHALQMLMEERIDRASRAVHLLYKDTTGVRYMISDYALESMPEEILLGYFSQQIARLLLKELKKFTQGN